MIRLRFSIFIFILFMGFANPSIWSAAFYKCKSISGDITFSDTPCVKTDETLRERTITRSKLSTIKHNDNFVENDDADDTEAIADNVSDTNKNHVLRSKILSILSSLSSLKIAMKSYFNENGKWPEKFSDINLNESEMNSKYVKRVKLDQGGKLVAYLKKELGNKKILMLQPKKINSMGQKVIEWNCYSNFTAQVLGTLNGTNCVSRKIYY